MFKIHIMRKFIENLNILSTEELNWIDDKLYLLSVEKGATLLAEGAISDKLFMVKSGILCNIYEDNNAEIRINCMAFENEFSCSFSSFMRQVPAHESIVALLDTKLEYIEQKELEALFDSSISWQKVGRKFVELHYVLMEEHFTNFQQKNGSIRYEFLLHNYPQQIRMIPQRYIASYLGISTRQLTRLRKSIF